MRRYDDPVEVRTGRVAGTGDHLVEGPEQFVWKGRLWKVHAVVAQWVETGPWWQSSGVHAVLGADDWSEPGGGPAVPAGVHTAVQVPVQVPVPTDLAAEREVWRVEAARGMAVDLGRGVFDLVFDWADGSWRLTGCLD
jgi:Family of unknown function (DUF6504)